MNVLSIQSSVALGHVGNSAATFALQRLGHEVWPINTVTLSNHLAHGGARGRTTPAAEIAELVAGLDQRGMLARCDAVLTGYLGDDTHGPAVSDAVAAVRAANPKALWLLDPVIGDMGPQGGKIYVKPGVAGFHHDRAVADADIVTPNFFELGYLADAQVDDMASALAAVEKLRTRGRAKLVVATGLPLRDRPADTLTVLAADASGAWSIETPRRAHPAYGAGDLFAAVLLARLLSGDDAPRAAAHAAASVDGVIAATPADKIDLELIAAQRELVAPARMFSYARVR